MYKIEDITKILEMEGHETEDGYNGIKTTLLGVLTDGITDYNTLTAERDDLKTENTRLKNANAMLYGQIEKQYTSKFGNDNKTDAKNEDEGETKEEKASRELSEQVELYASMS